MFNNSFHPHVWFRESQDEVLRNICSTGYRPIGMPKVWGQGSGLQSIRRCQGPEAGAGSGAATYTRWPAIRRFINPAEGDFRVKEGSPALKLGFKNFAMDQFGVVNPRLKSAGPDAED